MTANTWIRSFKVRAADVDFLTGLLLEHETPLSTHELARALIEKKLAEEREAVRARYADTAQYNPAHTYEPGQKLIFPALAFASAVVTDVRPGYNPQYGEFSVIQVAFDDDETQQREFAAGLAAPHKLSTADDAPLELPGLSTLTADDILAAHEEDILLEVESRLVDTPGLIYVAQRWFPRDLMAEVNEGHLNLAEAVLDIMNGGPMTTETILTEIGGLGAGAPGLEVFSMNVALDQDSRFDEVGPAGEVLWYLSRLEPAQIKQTPANLEYTPIPYDDNALTPDMRQLIREIGDELSDLGEVAPVDEARVILIYPHRRNGTLPLNAAAQHVFPTARRAPRIHVTLVDKHTGQEYIGWVAHRENYVYGLKAFYEQHAVPIGGHVLARRSDEPGKIIISYDDYRPRSEYLPLMSVRNDQVFFENIKRSIGAFYDDLMIIGVDDLAGLEAYTQAVQQQRKPLVSLMKLLLPPLGNLTPQGAVHAKTLYSALNALRRCPPEPMLATLNTNPDFENVGGHYWRLGER